MTLVVPSNIFANVAAADIRAGFSPLFTSLLFPTQRRTLVYLSAVSFRCREGKREGRGGGKISLGATDELLYGQGCLSIGAGGGVFPSRMRSLEIAGKFSIRSRGGNGKFLFSRLCKKKKGFFLKVQRAAEASKQRGKKGNP